ncbi:MAG: LytTR family DNA-binding domain-containing protein [Bacteroidota bacterium]
MQYKILIVEDEPLSAGRLQKLIENCGDEYEVVKIADSIEDATNWLKTNEPDLGLFDIQIADGLSFEILRNINFNLPVIFITAYGHHALQALKMNAIDYLLKPVKDQELKDALEKFKKQKLIISESKLYHLMNSIGGMAQPKYIERFRINLGMQIKVIQTDEIAYFYIWNKGVYLMTNNSEKYLLDMNLDEIENIVNPSKYFRINRQFIIGLSSIEKMVNYSKSRVKITLKPEAPLESITSVERSGEFKKWLSGL